MDGLGGGRALYGHTVFAPSATKSSCEGAAQAGANPDQRVFFCENDFQGTCGLI